MHRGNEVIREPHLVYYSVYGTKGCIERGRADQETAFFYFEGEMDKGEVRPITRKAPEYATTGGHGGSEHGVVKDFLDALDNKTKPPIDIIRAMDFTAPGIVAHEAVMRGNVWLEVPRFG